SVVPAPTIAADARAKRIAFTFPAAALGGRRNLAGARIHVTTWDYDGGWRALQPAAGSHAFGGGEGARDPLVMDELLLAIPTGAGGE
ncbi:MAG: hypothetical protein ACK5SH_10880, partial [Pseudomonadota bacterium]